MLDAARTGGRRRLPGEGDDPVAGALARRDLAVLEVLYGAGLRVCECCGLDAVRPRPPARARHRARQGLEGAPRAARRARARCVVANTSPAAGRCSLAPTARPERLFLNRRGRALTTRDARRIVDAPSAARRSDAAPARAPARVRDPPPGRRCRPARRARAARPRRPGHDPDLHPPHPRPPPGRLRGHPSPCLNRNPSTNSSRSSGSEYKGDGTPDARERLILHYSPLVKFVAGRVAAGLPQNIEQSDLVSYGIFGLIDAIDKFDPARGFKFETYAISRIKGAIIDELRSIDWVPRSIRAKARAIERAYSKLENELKRSPGDAEVAAELGVTRRGAQRDALADQLRRPGRARRAARGRATAGATRAVRRPSATRSPTAPTTRSRRSRPTR